MVFKGTSNRTAEDIARQVDSIGGNMDAFTGKETICFNVKVLDEHLPVAIDILSDMVLHPVFDAKEITRERGVILEEIKMDEDNPDYLVHEIFTQNSSKTIRWASRSWEPRKRCAASIRTRSSITTAESLLRKHDHFGGWQSRSHELVELLGERFGPLPPGPNGWHDTPPKTNSRIILRNKKSLEQVQICVGVPSYPHQP